MHVTTRATKHILTVSFTLSPTTNKRRKGQASCTTSNVYGNLSKNSFFSAHFLSEASAKVRQIFLPCKTFEKYFSKIIDFLTKVDLNRNTFYALKCLFAFD